MFIYKSGVLLVHIKHYSQSSKARTSLGSRNFVWDMGSLGHCSLIMMPGQEANDDNLETSFQSSIQKWYVECTDND